MIEHTNTNLILTGGHAIYYYFLVVWFALTFSISIVFILLWKEWEIVKKG